MLIREYGQSPKHWDKQGLELKDAPQPTSIIQKLLKNMTDGYKVDSLDLHVAHTGVVRVFEGNETSIPE